MSTYGEAGVNLEAAEELVARILEKRPNSPASRMLKGELLLARRKFGEAQAIFDAVIRTSLALYEQIAALLALGQICESLYQAFVVVATSPPAVTWTTSRPTPMAASGSTAKIRPTRTTGVRAD